MRRSMTPDMAAMAIIATLTAAPAWAGSCVATPAPVLGVGIGALALMGVGYRSLKRRIDR